MDSLQFDEENDAEKTNAELCRERDYWKHLFESMIDEFPQPMFTVDADGEITKFNAKAVETYNLPEQEVIGEHAGVFQPNKDETLVEEVVRTGESIREESFRALPDDEGGKIWIRAMGAPLTDSDGNVVGGVEMMPLVTELVEERERIEELQTKVSEEIKGSVTELETTASDIAEGSSDINALTDEQSDKIDKIASEVSSLSATVEEIASSADEVSTKSSRSEELAESAHESVADVVDSMDHIEAAGKAVAENTDDLQEKIDEIDDLVTVINDIADQTNLLALNASIEAARAGEAGSGFAVVADEIKQLASESQEQADEIERLVEEIHSNTDDTVESVEETNYRVENGMEHVEMAADRLERIAEHARETSQGIDEVAKATESQATSAEEIAAMIDETATQADQTAREAESIAAASEQQEAMVREVRGAVERLQETEIDE
ncbi:methyl-accepting chemotaxis protein [Halorussus pelagicus]|uniref:methyl-accepting chemotaxis protein n=1 Tax=Halorussus pelagicus TaxID=2505977 RepID=UPI000FFC93C5|nr:methyl-accepting chemotaxis protein [Halorussus pelagicus]